MRNRLMILLLYMVCVSSMALAAQDERLPDGINQILSSPVWERYSVTEIDSLAEWGTRDTVATILSRGEKNVLCVFSKASGEWKLVVKREKALYAGKQNVSLNFPDERLVVSYEFSNRLEEYYFSPTGKNKANWVMDRVKIFNNYHVNLSTGILSADVVEIAPTDNGLSYCEYFYSNNSSISKSANRTNVLGVIYTDLDEFNIYNFPKSLKIAKEKLTRPPKMPINTQRDALPEGVEGVFRNDEKHPVYCGPSELYARAANGKALVSTNDWIQVFGCENGMVLIQYAISSEKSRFGYITEETMINKNHVEALEFAYLPAMVLRESRLTDDPLNSKGEIYRVKEGEAVCFLATLGSEWTYVETLTLPPIRGFIPSDTILITE